MVDNDSALFSYQRRRHSSTLSLGEQAVQPLTEVISADTTLSASVTSTTTAVPAALNGWMPCLGSVR